MSFLWPELLPLLLAVPALAALYLYTLRRRKRAALRYSSLALAREAGAAAWRRHLPPAILLAALAAALFAAARPSALVTLPAQQRTIVLAIDVSLSMRATDIEPNRLAAAQAAARAFVQDVPHDLRIGIVSFAGTAQLVQKPTSVREDLVAAIERLQLDRHTAIGAGIIQSLATLLPEEGIDLETMTFGQRPGRAGPAGKTLEAQKAFKPVPPGSNDAAAIILLTDGRRTTGPATLDAARMAAERGIRVYTVGFGSAGGGHAPFEGYSIYMAFDEEALKAIAEVTRAEYFHAASAEELRKIYETLSGRFVLQKEQTEVSALFAAAAALLALVAGALSLAWFNRAF